MRQEGRPNYLQTYQRAHQREIKWLSDRDECIGMSVHTGLHDKDTWHCSKVAIICRGQQRKKDKGEERDLSKL